MKKSLLLLGLAACGTAAAVASRPAVYGTALEECNRNAQTLCESIACEDKYRAAAGRPVLPPPPSCSDAGLEGGAK